ncbi:putative transcriptional regulator YbaO [Escherichia coli T426]|nr:putative transcriptional regulator YbaO [Escherichia coli T426]
MNLSFCAVVFKPHRINCRDFTFKIELKEKKNSLWKGYVR